MLFRFVPVCAAALAIASMVGCGGNSAPHPTTEVTATVMYQGKPVEGATLTFVNEDHGSAIMAVGRTDAQGVAKMKTFGEADGAVKGTHRVSILKYTEAPPQAAAADVESEAYDPAAANKPAAPVKPLIPTKYGSANSPLSLEVGDTPVVHTFELED